MSAEKQAEKAHTPCSGNALDKGMGLDAKIGKGYRAPPSNLHPKQYPALIAPYRAKHCNTGWADEQTIGELLAREGGSIKTGPFGTALKASEYSDIGVPLISVREIGHGSFHIDAKTPRVCEATLSRLPEYILQDGDIVFARKGGIERCALIRKPQTGWFLGSDGIRLRPPKSCDARFIAYSLQTNKVKEWLVQNSTGSTMASLNQATIARLPIALPRIQDQVRVADALEILDDRIALLRETNATLEAMAQALFKSWFVDFDPVHANAGTRAATLPAELQALFPSTFTDTPQGPVPEGWKVGTIADAVEFVGGATPDTKNEEFWNPPAVAWTSPKDLSGLNTPVLLDTERKISMKGLAKISSGLLPAGSLLMSSRAPIGYLAIANISLAINQGYIAMLPSSRLPPLYMLFWCRQNMEVIKSRANGSTFMEISKKAFRPIELILPPAAVITEFIAMVEPLFQRIVENEKQAQTLATLRDTLLPRLISGQLRLPDAVAALAEAGA